jgi:hypothetical protein
MSRRATPFERALLFILWPVLAPVVFFVIGVMLCLAWPAILFADVKIG